MFVISKDSINFYFHRVDTVLRRNYSYYSYFTADYYENRPTYAEQIRRSNVFETT